MTGDQFSVGEQAQAGSGDAGPAKRNRIILSVGHILLALIVMAVGAGVAKFFHSPSGIFTSFVLIFVASFSVVLPLCLIAANWYRHMAQPQYLLSSSAERLFFRRLTWMFGPPLGAFAAAVLGCFILAVVSVHYINPEAFAQQQSTAQQAAAVTPPEQATSRVESTPQPQQQEQVSEPASLVLGTVSADAVEDGAGCVATNVGGETVFVSSAGGEAAIDFNGQVSRLRKQDGKGPTETYMDFGQHVRVTIQTTGEPTENGEEGFATPAILTLSALGRETSLAVTLTCGA